LFLSVGRQTASTQDHLPPTKRRFTTTRGENMLEEAEDKAARAAVEGRQLRSGAISHLPKPYNDNRQSLVIIETPYGKAN